jgi:hypothetical protein
MPEWMMRAGDLRLAAPSASPAVKTHTRATSGKVALLKSPVEAKVTAVKIFQES